MSTFTTALQNPLRLPIADALLLSLSLHLALLALVQPSPRGGETGTLVINARLAMPPATAAPTTQPPESPKLPPVAMPAEAEKPAAAAAPIKSPLLTSNVPSPAVPLPAAPAAAKVTPLKPANPPPAAVSAAVAAASGASSQASGSSAPISLGIDTTWYVARQVDIHARAVGNIEPAYPDEARLRNQEGTLKLMLKIDDLGRVRDAEVVEADPPGIFDAAALEAFRNARFYPAIKDGRPVRYQAYVRVVFKLRD